MSRRRRNLLRKGPEQNAWWVPPGYGARHVSKERCGTGEARLRSPGRGKAARISRR